MKLLLSLIFLSSSLFAGTCQEMASSLQKVDQIILSANVKECAKEDDTQIEYPGFDEDLIKEYRCANLATLDQEIANIHEQETIVMGFGKLKEDIKAQKKIVAAGKVKEQQKAAVDFANGVEKAAVLEAFIQSEDIGKDPFLAAVKNIPLENRSDASDFNRALKSLCLKAKDSAACKLDSNTVINAFPEIEALLNKGPVTKAKTESWKKSLSIKKTDDSQLSFASMYADLKDLLPKLRNQEMLSRADLLTLKKIPDFENADQDFPFLADLKKFKEAQKPQYAQQKFTALVEDLKGRQESELKLMIGHVQNDLPRYNKETSQKCTELLSGTNFVAQIDGCMSDLKDISEGKEELKKMYRSLEVAQNFYNNNINSYLTSCQSEEVFKLAVKSEKLPSCLANLDSQRAVLNDKMLALTQIRKKVVASNDQMMRLRDYALEKMMTDKCRATGESVSEVGECADDAFGSITPSVKTLIFDGMDIGIKYANMTSGSELSKICDETIDDPRAKTVTYAFCKKPEATVATPTTPAALKNAKPTTPKRNLASAPALTPYAPERDYVKEGFSNGLGYFFGTVSNALRTPVYNPLNPYAYGYPYSNPIYSMSQASSLYGGGSAGTYGYYNPTVGVPTYSSFTPYTSSWVNPKPVTFTSTYFAQ
jgi:hypothetical protein